MSDIKWVGNHIEVAPPKKPKKLTGTRFAAILGLNKWSSPFEIWCAVTRTYEKPFEDTIYTVAGKTIEPKQAEYMKRSYAMFNLKTPTDIFGKDYFKTTWGDFFHDTPVFGGMWDYLDYGDSDTPEVVLEMKTTKRSEDWAQDIPEYYALQAALYAHLLGIDDVIMVASFLEASDYEHPENFVPNASNTITVDFRVSERYPNFQEKIDMAMAWWNQYVVTGISPDFDEKVDAEILKALRTNTVSSEEDVSSLIAEAEELKVKLDAAQAAIEKDEKRYKALTDAIKKNLMSKFRDGDKKVTMNGAAFSWEVSRSDSVKVDEDALKADGLLDKYKTKVATTYRLTMKKTEK